MNFGKKLWMEGFNGLLSIEVGGGVAMDGGIATDSGSAGTATIDQPPGGDAGGTPGGSDGGSSGSDGGAGASTDYVLNKAPGERGTQEYKDWYQDLSYEDQRSVERELREGVQPKTANKADASSTATDGNNGTNQNPAGDATADGDVGEWTPEEFATLDPKSQARVQEMQGIISKFEPFLDGSLDKGLEIIDKDPYIQARLEQIKNQGRLSLPESVTKKFDVNDFISPEEKKHFELLDDKGRSTFAKTLMKAYEKGAENGLMSEKYNTQTALVHQERVNKFTKELEGMVAISPSLKPPVDSQGNPVKFQDPSHPLNPYLKWVSANGYSDEIVEKIGHKAVYASYLAATGKQSEVMTNLVKQTRTNFIKSLSNADRMIATTAGRGTQSPGSATAQNIDGINMEMYQKDQAYRKRSFENADFKTRQKLEYFANTGKVPS